MLKPLITGTEDITLNSLDWKFISPESPAIKRWIEKEGLDSLEIPRGGKLVQMSDLNAFLEKAGRPPVEIQEKFQ